MKKTHKIIMLPTEDKSPSNILLWEISQTMEYYKEIETTRKGKSGIPQYLYIVSDEEIKEGDHVFLEDDDPFEKDHLIIRVTDAEIGIGESGNSTIAFSLKDAKKVLATTDPKLKTPYMAGNTVKGVRYERQREVNGISQVKTLPQIPQSFIDSYTKNPVDEVELEYVRGSYYDWMKAGASPVPDKLKLNNNEVVINQKVFSHNNTTPIHIHEGVQNIHVEVKDGVVHIKPNITSVENKLYTHEEVVALFEKARVELMDKSFNGDAPDSYVDKNELEKRLKENLIIMSSETIDVLLFSGLWLIQIIMNHTILYLMKQIDILRHGSSDGLKNDPDHGTLLMLAYTPLGWPVLPFSMLLFCGMITEYFKLKKEHDTTN